VNELERARLLAAIARDAAASGDLDACLRIAMDRLHGAIRFKGGCLAFPDDDGLLAIRVAIGVIDEAARAVRPPARRGHRRHGLLERAVVPDRRP